MTHVAVFPTHVIDGIENHRLKEAAKKYAGAFEQIAVADALLANRRIMRMWQKHCGSR